MRAGRCQRRSASFVGRRRFIQFGRAQKSCCLILRLHWQLSKRYHLLVPTASGCTLCLDNTTMSISTYQSTRTLCLVARPKIPAVVTWFDAIENDRLHQLDACIEHVADFASVALLAIRQQQQSKLDGAVARRLQIAEFHDPHGQFAGCRTVGQSQIDQAASVLLCVRRYGHRRHGRHRLGFAERTRQVRYVQNAFLQEKVTQHSTAWW